MAKPPVKVTAVGTRKQFAAKIAGHFNDARDGIMKAGAALNFAKEALDHGEFTAMIENDLPFGARTARTLMAIAADAWLSKRKHASVLPASARALYGLTKLPDAAKEKALKNGDITPDTTEPDVRRLVMAAGAGAASVEKKDTPGRFFQDIGEGLAGLAVEIAAGAAKPFRVILADPAWRFETWSEKGGGRSPPYLTMAVEEICDLGYLIQQVVADDAALFLWSVGWSYVESDVRTSWSGGDAYPDDFSGIRIPSHAIVMKAWGFDHVTKAYCWVKQDRKGGLHRAKGKWTRGNAEDCWFGARGAPRRLSAKEDELVLAPVMEHSRKPAQIHDGIERLVRGPYLELFGCRERDGWTVLGNEIARPGGPADVGPPVVGRGKEIVKPGPAFAEATAGEAEEDLLAIPPSLRREA